MLKRVFIFSSIIALLFVVSGCGGDTAQDEQLETENVDSQNEQEPIVPLEAESDALLLREVTSESLNLVDCEIFPNEISKQECLDKIYFNKAKEELDANLCLEILEPLAQKQCLSYLEVNSGKEQALKGVIQLN
ncbi:hypothetical protein ACFL3C_04830 [Patescibacteria group bacterium]